MVSDPVRCNTGVGLTVTEYLLFDAARAGTKPLRGLCVGARRLASGLKYFFAPRTMEYHISSRVKSRVRSPCAGFAPGAEMSRL